MMQKFLDKPEIIVFRNRGHLVEELLHSHSWRKPSNHHLTIFRSEEVFSGEILPCTGGGPSFLCLFPSSLPRVVCLLLRSLRF